MRVFGLLRFGLLGLWVYDGGGGCWGSDFWVLVYGAVGGGYFGVAEWLKRDSFLD